MSSQAQKLLEEALLLSNEEKLELIDKLLASLPVDDEWNAELERRARRALDNPQGGEAWEVVKQRLERRIAGR